MPETVVPAIPPVPIDVPSGWRSFLLSLKEVAEVREGVRGNPLDSFITFRDLSEAGALVVNTIVLAGRETIHSIVAPLPDGMSDFTIPPAVTGLTVTGALASNIVEWSEPAYSNHAYVEVWRSVDNNLGNAVMVGRGGGSLFADDVGDTGLLRYYWIRAVSLGNVAGPFNAVNGTSDTTLAVLTNHIADFAVTNAKIGNLAVDSAKIADASIVTAKIANLAVTAAKIEDATITSAKIANAAITTALIGDAQITTAKIADAQITTAKIIDAQITTAKIALLAVTDATIANLTITGDKLVANTIYATKLNTQQHAINGLTFTNNSPSAGFVAWTGPTISWNGNTYSVTSGSTSAEMIWFDRSASTTALQGSTRAAFEAAYNVSDGDILLAVNLSGMATVVFNTTLIEAASIKTGTITAAKLSVTQLSAITADLGAITAGTIVLSSAGHIRAGQTAYNTGTGFWLGIDSSTPKFSLGSSSSGITFNGTTTTVVGKLVAPSNFLDHTAGSTLIMSSDVEKQTTAPATATPTILKEIRLARPGTVTVKITLRTAGGGTTGKGRIYKNGVAHGTERDISTSTPTEFSEDLVFATGDLVQFYCWWISGSGVFGSNFRLYSANGGFTDAVTLA